MNTNSSYQLIRTPAHHNQTTTTGYSTPPPEQTHDPLQEWLLFEPQHPHPHPHHSPSFPSHDGRGHFFSPEASLEHSPDRSSNLDFSWLDHNAPPSPSLLSLSDLHSSDDHDDLLSIPSSISVTLSSSRRSSDCAADTHHRAHYQLSAQETELLLNPMAISAGLSPPGGAFHGPTNVGSQHSKQEGPSARPDPVQLRPAGPVRPASLPPPITLLPPPKPARHLLHQPPPSLDFLATVASKILHLDPDTLDLLASPYPQDFLPLRSSDGTEKTTQARPQRFMIGDGDTERMRVEGIEDDEIRSPLDLSGFMVRAGGGSGEVALERTGSWETLKAKERKLERRTLSDHQLSAAVEPLDLPLPRDRRSLPASPPASSMAGILFKKVWDQWTEWDL